MRTLCLLLIALCLSACGAAGHPHQSPRDRAAALERVDRPAPTAEEAALFAGSANQLGFDMWARMQAVPGDQVFSPASIAVALDMTYAGARGDTATQMAGVLGIDPAQSEALHEAAGNSLAQWNDPSREAYTLAVANRLFGEQRFQFEQPFLDLTSSTYGAPLERLDFRTAFEPSRVHINDWVAVQTNDRIRDLIPTDAIDRDTRLVLTNAVYFHARWGSPFERHATYPAEFHTAAGESVQAETMHQTANVRYAEVPGAQIVDMPYYGDDLSMTIVLPRDRDGLAAVEAGLSNERWAEWISALSRQHVAIALPKFRIEPAESISLKDHLEALGMPLAFDEHSADFRGMAPINEQGRLYISDVFHKAFIAVDEDGTEAAAATAVIMAEETSVSVEPRSVPFVADHPFLFVIRDTRSGAILFMGRLADPT